MPVQQVTLPTKATVRLIFVESKGVGRDYFNAKRLGVSGGVTEETYYLRLPKLVSALVAEVQQPGIQFDAVLRIASSGIDAVPYMTALCAAFPGITDLTPNLTRKGRVRAANGKTTLADLIEEFEYTPSGAEVSFKSLLIVDETYATGKSVAAVLEHLRGAGLPEDADITVAVCAMIE